MARKKAFTLVELLVVIAIIALLMSILMPALARVRKQAKDVLGQSNLKQWGTCFSMYTGDNDSSFPRGWFIPDAKVKPGDYWMHALRPYSGNEHNLRCCPMVTKHSTEFNPTDIDGGIYPDSTFIGWGVFTGEPGEVCDYWWCVIAGDYGSYGWNSYVCNIPDNEDYDIDDFYVKNNWKVATVKSGGNIPLLGDAQWIDCWPNHGNEPPEWHGQPWHGTSSMGRICIDRHDGTVNWVFLDYSVKKIGLKQLWKLKWNRRFDIDGGPTPAQFDAHGDGWMSKYKDYE